MPTNPAMIKPVSTLAARRLSSLAGLWTSGRSSTLMLTLQTIAGGRSRESQRHGLATSQGGWYLPKAGSNPQFERPAMSYEAVQERRM
ncbi:hypothetical protein GCM10018965_073700 [Nonomuraea roseola]